MHKPQIPKVLQGLGLTSREAAVYTASLSIGPTTVLHLAQASGVKRTTVYSVLESLKQKGLMTTDVRGFKNFFAPENPERLEQILDSRKELLRSNLAELSALYNLKGGESTIKYYEGFEAMKGAYEELLKDVRPQEDYLVVSDQEQWLRLDIEYFKKFQERRAKLPINIRMLLVDSPGARETKKFGVNFKAQVKILPPGTSLITNLVVIPSRVIIHQLTPPVMAIVIENKSVVQMHREMFEIMWKVLPN